MKELIKEYRRLEESGNDFEIKAFLESNSQNELLISLIEFKRVLIPAIADRFSK